jgi:hypothetical protein
MIPIPYLGVEGTNFFMYCMCSRTCTLHMQTTIFAVLSETCNVCHVPSVCVCIIVYVPHVLYT